MMRSPNSRGLAIALVLAGACSTGGDPARPLPPQNAGGPEGLPGVVGDAQVTAPPPYQVSTRGLVQWKRHAAFEADLMRALALTRDQLCVEVGGKNCVRDVHLVPLGGNEPYESGLMKPSAEPLATTSSAVDRVVLSACSTRARLDAEGSPQVFRALNFKAPLPGAADPTLSSTTTDLYRRLLARDPAPSELALVVSLAEPESGATPLSTQEFAALSCFTIASSTEFLFF